MKQKWEVKKLGDVIAQVRGVSYKPNDLSPVETSDYIPLLRANNIQDSLIFDELQYVLRNRVSKKQLIQQGDILVCTSSGSKHLVGKAAQATKDYDLTFGAFCKVIRPLKINAKLLGYFFKSNRYRGTISFLSRGANINNLKAKDIDEILIPVPPMEVQEAIVKELDTLYLIKEKQEEQLAQYDNLAQSTFYSMFGDPIDNEKGWEVRKLGEVCDVVSGSTPRTKDPMNWNGSINWITPAEIDDDSFYIKDTERKITRKAFDECNLKLLPKNTVLLSSRAPIGKVAIVGTEMCCNQGFKNLICKNGDINHIFLYFLLKQNNLYLNCLGRGATFKELSKTIVSSIEFGNPDLCFQTAFAERIEHIEAQKELLKKSIADTQLLIDYTMDKYFG